VSERQKHFKTMQVFYEFYIFGKAWPFGQVPVKNNNDFYFFVFPKFAGRRS